MTTEDESSTEESTEVSEEAQGESTPAAAETDAPAAGDEEDGLSDQERSKRRGLSHEDGPTRDVRKEIAARIKKATEASKEGEAP